MSHRMLYPWWVTELLKRQAIDSVKSMINEAKAGREWKWEDDEVARLAELYAFHGESIGDSPPSIAKGRRPREPRLVQRSLL